LCVCPCCQLKTPPNGEASHSRSCRLTRVEPRPSPRNRDAADLASSGDGGPDDDDDDESRPPGFLDTPFFDPDRAEDEGPLKEYLKRTFRADPQQFEAAYVALVLSALVFVSQLIVRWFKYHVWLPPGAAAAAAGSAPHAAQSLADLLGDAPATLPPLDSPSWLL